MPTATASAAQRPRVRRARRRLLDVGTGLWVALWLVIGTWTAVEVWSLSELTSTVSDSGVALDEAGEALESLQPVPVVGKRSAELGAEVRENARDVVADAMQARGSFRRLSVLLGAAIALVPTVPVVLLSAVLTGRLTVPARS